MSKDVYTLTAPDGSSMELPIRSGTMGPEVMEIGRLFAEQGVFTFDPGFVSTGSCDIQDNVSSMVKKGVLMPIVATRLSSWPSIQTSSRSAYLLLYGELPTDRRS